MEIFQNKTPITALYQALLGLKLILFFAYFTFSFKLFCIKSSIFNEFMNSSTRGLINKSS